MHLITYAWSHRNVLHRPGENVVGIMSSARKFSETPSIMLIMADLSAPERWDSIAAKLR